MALKFNIISTLFISMALFLGIAHADPNLDPKLNVTDKKVFHYDQLTIAIDQDLLSITADSNPTTGFDWKFKKFDPTKFEEQAPIFRVDPQDEYVTGAGGVGTYSIKALASGKEIIYFQYLRDWEGGEIYQTYQINIETDEAHQIKNVDFEKLTD